MAVKISINLRLGARNRGRQARVIGKQSKMESLIQAGAFGKPCLLESLIQENFWAEPVAPSISDFAETLKTVTEKQLRANKLILIGRKIKRHFPGFGGWWGVVESYHVDKDVYRLR